MATVADVFAANICSPPIPGVVIASSFVQIRLQKSQQSFESEILARQTGKSELLARARTGGTGAHLA